MTAEEMKLSMYRTYVQNKWFTYIPTHYIVGCNGDFVKVNDMETIVWATLNEEANENSQITYFSIGGFGFLFLGDIPVSVEEQLTLEYNRLNVTVLKVAHHGSRTSTGDRLLSVYRIPFAVISAGRGNSYGHPHEETLNRLQAYKVKVLCTREDSAIEFMVFNGFMVYKTALGKTGLYLGQP